MINDDESQPSRIAKATNCLNKLDVNTLLEEPVQMRSRTSDEHQATEASLMNMKETYKPKPGPRPVVEKPKTQNYFAGHELF
mmetsp:Transcript_26465/g.30493  ORF Transcript_26465/g.30493 Transcript_26465/m.30493 type:complete len:82 (-) Transcript_26465:212-457(-)